MSPVFDARRRNLVLDRDGFLLSGLLRLLFVSASRDLAVCDILCIDRRKRRGQSDRPEYLLRFGLTSGLGSGLGRLRGLARWPPPPPPPGLSLFFRVMTARVLRIAGNRSVIVPLPFPETEQVKPLSRPVNVCDHALPSFVERLFAQQGRTGSPCCCLPHLCGIRLMVTADG